MLNILAIALFQLATISASNPQKDIAQQGPAATSSTGANDIATLGGSGGWGGDVATLGGSGGWGGDVATLGGSGGWGGDVAALGGSGGWGGDIAA